MCGRLNTTPAPSPLDGLPEEFSPQLNVARTTAPENRIRSGDVGSELGQSCVTGTVGRAVAEAARKFPVDAREIGVVQDVEKLGAKLKRDAFAKLRILAHGKIPVGEVRTPENIPTHITKRSISRRR